MYKVTVTQKWQIMMPAEHGKKFKIKKGIRLLAGEEKTSCILRIKCALKSKESMIECLLNKHSAEYKAIEHKWERMISDINSLRYAPG
ncbi:MAG: hypothetical protein KA120_07440 [Candidatus Goldbacteria bacterium]|nr:hypothetical protein [Candidatus Goldiibacteriota bacterium]